MHRLIVPFLFISIPIWTYYMWGIIWIIWGIVIDIVLLPLTISIVSPNSVKIVERFEKFNRIYRKWFHFLIPFVERTRLQILYKRDFLYTFKWITKKKLDVNITLNIIYYVYDDLDNTKDWSLYKSIYSIDDPVSLIKTIINNEFKTIISKYIYEDIIANQEEVWIKIKEKVNVQLKEIGYQLDSVQIKETKVI